MTFLSSWVLGLCLDKLWYMVLELDRRTLSSYPTYEKPASIYYDAKDVLRRVSFLTGTSPLVSDLCVALFEKSTSERDYCLPPNQIAMEVWEEPRALVNRFLSNEEARVQDGSSWIILKRILMGNFDPQKMLIELNKKGYVGKDTDQWELLRDLTLAKENSKDEDSNHV